MYSVFIACPGFGSPFVARPRDPEPRLGSTDRFAPARVCCHPILGRAGGGARALGPNVVAPPSRP